MRFHILFVLLIAFALDHPTGARAEICIQGVRDCAETATTSQGGFDPKHPWDQRSPTKESTVELLEYFSAPCLPIPLGKRTIYPPPGTEKYLADLQSAGIITYQKKDPAPDGDRGQVEFDVTLTPTIGPEHFKSTSCLKMAVSTNIVVTNWEERNVWTTLGTKKVIIVEGTLENGPYDEVYLRYLRTKNAPPPIIHEKFRLRYVYNDASDFWHAGPMDEGDAGEAGFRTNHVDDSLRNMVGHVP